MKTPLFTIRMLIWLLGVVSLTSGFAQNIAPCAPASAAHDPPALAVAAFGNPAVRATLPTAGARLSPWSAEVLALAQADINEDVMRSFVDNCGLFNLNAEHIIQLDRAGVPSTVVTAMLQHDADVTAGVKVLTVTSRPKLDPEVERVLLALRDLPERATPSPEPAVPTDASEKKAVVLPETASVDKPTATETVGGAKAASPEKPSAPKLGSAYRTPETRPAEIVPPYLVINAASRTPNVIIIDMFPSSR